jgi:branched-chain amino acid transport system ATP-binding protein
LTQAVLKVEGLRAGYGPISVLHGLDFTAGEGEIVGLVGPNGAGKSTFLETLAGTLKPRAGAIELSGRRIDRRSTLQRRKAGLMLVPQEAYVFPLMSVRANLDVGGLFNRPKRNRELLGLVEDLFPILKERQTQLASTMSGGQQKMLAVAVGIMGDAKVLLIDEPSIGLAPQLVTRLFAVLKRFKEETGKTLVLAEQNIKILDIADRLYGLEAGEFRFQDRTANLDETAVKDLFMGE